jgi:transcription elongation GreA/GreB family factor
VLTRDREDPVNGFVSVNSPLGSAVFGQNEEDEVDVSIGGRLRQAFIVSAEREGAWQQ